MAGSELDQRVRLAAFQRLDVTSTRLIPWIADRFAGKPAGTSCPG